MLGLIALDPERIARLTTALLSVLGGYLAGFAIVGVCAYFFDRRVTGGKAPAGMHRAARHIGGVTGAVLVALMVFGGLGDGGGPGGTGTGTNTAPGVTGTGTGTPATSSSESPSPAVIAPEPELPTDEVVQVTVLSGAAVRGERFYLIDDDKEPVTIKEVKERVRGKRPAPGHSLSIALRLTPRTDPNNSGVQVLETWARDAGMRVILPRKE